MQTKQTTGLRPMEKKYVVIVNQACNKLKGFLKLHKKMKRAICITGKVRVRSTSPPGTALRSVCARTDAGRVKDFLQLVKSRGTASARFFKFTGYGVRYI